MFTCQCVSGYTGDQCETSNSCILLQFCLTRFLFHSDIDECELSPCENGGTCIDGIDYFTCHCFPGYTGDYCETSGGVFG